MTVELMAAVPVGDRRRGLVQVCLQQKTSRRYRRLATAV